MHLQTYNLYAIIFWIFLHVTYYLIHFFKFFFLDTFYIVQSDLSFKNTFNQADIFVLAKEHLC